jgi:hypothetical protein
VTGPATGLKVAIALAVGLLVVGCGMPGYDQRGGQVITDKIAAASSPLVLSVEYQRGDYMDPASTNVVVRPGVTKVQAVTLICDVIDPIIAAGDPPESFGVTVWDSTESAVLATDDDPCA